MNSIPSTLLPPLPPKTQATRSRRRGGAIPVPKASPFWLGWQPSVAVGIPYPCEDVDAYYAGLEGLEGAGLMRRLGVVVAGQRALRYKEVWDALKVLDAADADSPEASSDVIEIYSLKAVPKAMAGKPEGWNREHLWPRSYGLEDAPSLTDLHNLRPADANVNSSRGNKYYGECVPGRNHCLQPANAEAAYDTETDKQKWAPPLEVKGDVARSVMYMAVRYGLMQPGGSSYLRLSDSPSIKTREMGLLSALLKWNEIDPPSREEKLRNVRVCSLYQHNRNPFVDHPEYANLIWKRGSSDAWINEFHYDNKGKDQNEFLEVVVGPSADVAGFEIVLYNGASGKMYRSLSLDDHQVFSLSSSDSTFQIYTAYMLLQNGPSDGIALISTKNHKQPEVIQFISYEGILKATDGPAAGVESTDIQLQESEASSKHDSIGLTGKIGELVWRKFSGNATPGNPNPGEDFE